MIDVVVVCLVEEGAGVAALVSDHTDCCRQSDLLASRVSVDDLLGDLFVDGLHFPVAFRRAGVVLAAVKRDHAATIAVHPVGLAINDVLTNNIEPRARPGCFAEVKEIRRENSGITVLFVRFPMHVGDLW